jgi:hypothetical protein
MYFVILLLGLLVVVILAKLDKYSTIKHNWKVKLSSYDAWVESLEGRRIIYKIAMVICVIPCVNYAIVFLGLIAIVVLLGLNVSASKFWGHDFWDKLF